MQEEITLYKLNSMIRNAMKDAFPRTLKIVAEIAEMNVNRTGHCYLNLVEKSEQDDSIKAQARATIWASAYRMIKPYFETTTGRKLEKGLKVLVSVEVVFHEAFGFSLNIKDIDPSYTLGEIERRRREILKYLEKEGLLDRNQRIPMPFHPKKIAVISSPTAAGYGDFVNQLDKNPNGFSFAHKLFPAIMQGDRATDSIIEAFHKIAEYDGFFDCVVLIRGGGSSTDLACFDTLELALEIVQSPFPVIAGIGHERDITIADTVAHTRVKTPTAAAAYLINKVAEIETFINDREVRFLESVKAIIEDGKDDVRHISAVFAPKVKTLLKQESGKYDVLRNNMRLSVKGFLKDSKSNALHMLDNVDRGVRYKINKNRDKLSDYPKEIARSISHILSNKKMSLEKYLTVISLSNPENLLKKGYSLTYSNGELVKDISSLKKGQDITTVCYGGEIDSLIKEIHKKK